MRGCALQRRFVCHGGLTPPALDCCTIVRPWKTAFCDAQTHIRLRAAGVSPPWFAIPTLYGENRASFRDRRTDNEERRALARRGFVNRVCNGNAMNFRVSRAHARSPFHGGLTPPAPGCTHACRRGCAVVLCNSVSFPTGGLRPPLLIAARSFVRGKPPFAMHKRTSGQEQRASARRGMVRQLQPCSCTDHRLVASAPPLWRCRCKRVSETPAGLRQPLLLAPTHVVADARLCFATAFRLPRGAYAPRS
jgi:hypothetical protein